MWITNAVAILLRHGARTIAVAFELVCRIAGPMIELPPRSKTNASETLGALPGDVVLIDVAHLGGACLPTADYRAELNLTDATAGPRCLQRRS